MKLFKKFHHLPLGAIKAEGFLRDQMLLGKDGMAGHLYELEPEMIYYPYIDKRPVPAWSGDGANVPGWGAEISGNYWAGYIQHAFVLDDPEMKEIATNWVNNMLKNRQADGYLGTYIDEDDDIYDDYNAQNTCAMRGLLAFYEATGRKDVLDAVHDCMLWFTDKWAGDKKTVYSGQTLIEGMILTYWHTGDTRLVDFAEEYLEYICTRDLCRMSYKSMLEDKHQYLATHTVAVAHHLMNPALVYSATGREELLRASLRKLGQLREKSMHITGSPVSIAEYLGPVCATAETEYCNYAVLNTSYAFLSCITGEARFGDYMETLFYNGAQGGRKKDERAIPYLNAPNQIFAARDSSAFCGDHQMYAPVYTTSCCPVNSVRVVPEFIRGMLVADFDDNIYTMAYGPCSISYKGIEFEEKTNYPFRNSVVFEMKCEKEFALNLKIPEWSKGYIVKLNGEEQNLNEKDSFVTLNRLWKKGDTVEITFKAEIEVSVIDDTDAASKYPLAVSYGALIFALQLPEKWTAVHGNPMTPLPEGWSWWDVTPTYVDADIEEIHERVGMRRYQYSWNVAVDENWSAKDFEIEEIEPCGYAWANPMIKLHTHCYKAPFLTAPYQNKTLETFEKYQTVTEKIPLELVPFGCTALRITYFPRARLK